MKNLIVNIAKTLLVKKLKRYISYFFQPGISICYNWYIHFLFFGSIIKRCNGPIIKRKLATVNLTSIQISGTKVCWK